jgi:hypothetical protein
VNEQANNSARPNVHSDTVSANIGHGRAPKIVKCDGAAEQESYDYAGRRGWQIVEEFIDQGVSGGSAMRVAPLGAYFADDPERIADQVADPLSRGSRGCRCRRCRGRRISMADEKLRRTSEVAVIGRQCACWKPATARDI